MSNIDKQALRSKALSASPDEWIKETSDGWGAICSSDDQANGGFIIAHFVGPDSQANREFVQAANPITVLALLDDLEAAEKRIAELEAREVKLPKSISVLHRRDFMDAHQSIYAYPEAEVNAALADAGINVAAAAKGE
ncbi:TPA: ead/Ea22-like family protein [Enterobacter asburiae]|uniref:Ead/Ea22-like family protein n=1 Tax=Enterobacter asburiae TaxID=61645 RepID=A0A455VYM6_ENTAS|nr:hypothetical protein MRY18106EAS_26680 [Enterobacter asburiae]HDR2660249.1 ead/Ea22-like family protein [Enterobacter asburiae]